MACNNIVLFGLSEVIRDNFFISLSSFSNFFRADSKASITVFPVAKILALLIFSVNKFCLDCSVGSKLYLAKTDTSRLLASSGQGEYRLSVQACFDVRYVYFCIVGS